MAWIKVESRFLSGSWTISRLHMRCTHALIGQSGVDNQAVKERLRLARHLSSSELNRVAELGGTDPVIVGSDSHV
jgi:hypothetical protein